MQKKPCITFISFYDEIALGIRTLHAILTRAGFPCRMIFFQSWGQPSRYPTEKEMRLLYELIEQDDSQIYGLSFRTIVYHLANKVTGEIRGRKGKDTMILWGGSHPTLLPEECIKTVDAVCVGEGEEAVLELMQAIDGGKDFSDIKNLWVRTGSGIKRNPIRPLVQDLDSVPWPIFGDEGKSAVMGEKVIHGDPKYQKSALATYFVLSSRGCPFSCDFCCNSALKKIYAGAGAYIRKRSPENIIAELKHAKDNLDLVYVAFMDELFTMQKSWTMEVCRLYRAQINVPFTCEIHPETVDEEMAKALGDAGMRSVVLGVQSCSERGRRDIYHRPVLNRDILKAARLLHEQGALINYDLILDNPYETRADLQEGFQLLLELPRPNGLEIFSLTYYPGTNITERALKDKLIRPEDVEGVTEKPFKSILYLFDQALNRDNAFYSMLFYLYQLKFSFGRLVFYYFSISDEPRPAHVIPLAVLKKMEASEWLYQNPERLYALHRLFIVHLNRLLGPVRRLKTALGLLLKAEFREMGRRARLNPAKTKSG